MARPPSLLLAGDIGGTKTNLALFELRAGAARSSAAGRLVKVDRQRFEAREYGRLEDILDAFLKPRRARLASAAFGIAGPVLDDRSKATNLPWVVDGKRLSRRMRIPVALVNDLEATAYALPSLDEASLCVLNEGRGSRRGSLALIAAGTGLGEAFVLREVGGFLVGATEGGHCDFAPRTDDEIALLRFLAARHGHVSVERVVSGPGLVNVYEFLATVTPGGDPALLGGHSWAGKASKATSPLTASPATRARSADGDQDDEASAISKAALARTSPRAERALEMFVSAYGAEAGNLALKVLATGGVYLGGGIAPKLLPALRDGRFLEAFVAKGRFRDLLGSIPVAVILDEEAALLGAARIACERVRARGAPR